MEFALDWKTGQSQVTRVFYRPESQSLPMPETLRPARDAALRSSASQSAYFSDSDNSNPTGGAAVCFLWIDRDGVAVPVAAMGRANDWSVLKARRIQIASGPPASIRSATPPATPPCSSGPISMATASRSPTK